MCGKLPLDKDLFREIRFEAERYPKSRHNFSVDFGNVCEDLGAADLSDQEYTIGTGIRWNIESFARTDLFLDYGYEIELSNGKLYGSNWLIFQS